MKLKNSLLLLFILLWLSQISFCQSAIQIIQNSIEYHDPEGKLFDSEVIFSMRETRPSGPDRLSTLSFDIKKEIFHQSKEVDNLLIDSYYKKGKASFTIDKEKKYSKEITEKYKLNSSRLEMMKNYYQYLWLMPMKLNDPGTILDPKVKTVDFFGKESLQIKVTYDPSVGNDIWYFYFHPKDFALQGYRFYHNETANDGEYILLTNEVTYENVRLPKERAWYTHKEDKFLGTDILEKIMID